MKFPGLLFYRISRANNKHPNANQRLSFSFSFLFFLLFLLIASPAWADSQSFSLLDAYRLAQHNNSSVSISMAEVNVRQEQSIQARAQFFPKLYLRGYGEVHHQQVNLSGIALPDDNFSSIGYQAGLAQPLFRRTDMAIYRHAKVESEIASVQQQLAEQELMFNVAEAYFNVLIAQESLATAKSQTSAITHLFALAKSAYQDGDASITDVDEARASYDLARTQAIMAKSDLEIRKQLLRRYTGRLPVRLSVFLGAGSIYSLEPEEMFLWERLALDKSLVLELTKLELRGADGEVDVAEGGHYPVIDFVANYSQGDVDGDTTTEAMAGLTLELPLYNGGGDVAKVREAKANRMKQKYILRDITEQVLMDVRQAYLTVINSRLLVQATKQAFDSSEALLESTHDGFDKGIRNSLDVLNAQLGVFENQREMVSADYNFLNAVLRLKMAAGTLALADLQVMDRMLVQPR